MLSRVLLLIRPSRYGDRYEQDKGNCCHAVQFWAYAPTEESRCSESPLAHCKTCSIVQRKHAFIAILLQFSNGRQWFDWAIGQAHIDRRIGFGLCDLNQRFFA